MGCASCGQAGILANPGGRPQFDGGGQLINMSGQPNAQGICPDGTEATRTWIVALNGATLGSIITMCFFGSCEQAPCIAAAPFFDSVVYNGDANATLNELADILNSLGAGFQANVVSNVLYVSVPLAISGPRCDTSSIANLCAYTKVGDVYTATSIDTTTIKELSCDCGDYVPQTAPDIKFKVCLNDCKDFEFVDIGQYPIGSGYDYKLTVWDVSGNVVDAVEGRFEVFDETSQNQFTLDKDKYPDGVYRFVYEVFDDAGQLISASTRFVVIDCSVRCCYQKLAAKINLNKCKPQEAAYLYKIGLLIRAAQDKALCTNSLEDANKILATAKKICAEINCMCK